MSGDDKSIESLVASSSLLQHAGRSGLKIKPVWGWVSLNLLIIFAAGSLFIVALIHDFASWFWHLTFFVLVIASWLLSILIAGVNRQLDKQLWLDVGNLGRFPLTITSPRGMHVQEIDESYYLGERGTFVPPGKVRLRITRLLWQPCGVAAGAGMDGGKQYGHVATISTIEETEDGGKTWKLRYRHPILKIGDAVRYFQFFVPTAYDELPEGMLEQLKMSYEEDVTTGEVAIAEGFYTFGKKTEGEFDIRAALEDVFYPEAVIPPAPALSESRDLRNANELLREDKRRLLSDLARAGSYASDIYGGR